MGGGDWNDGMNRVGHEGRGESVWLAWFLITTLKQFQPIAAARGDKRRATPLAAIHRAADPRLRCRRGTATGIDAPTSMMARHWDRR